MNLSKYLDREEIKFLIPLAIPMLITQISQVAMGFVDTVMAARVSATDMSGVAVATSIFYPVILTCLGILLVLGPIIANLSGARKQTRISHYMNQSFWLAGVMSVIAIVILSLAEPFIRFITEDEELIRISSGYLKMILWGVPAFLGFACLRTLNEGMSMTKPAMIVGILGLLVNIPANYCFVYGKFGAPALGGIGCGVATSIVYWVMFLALLLLILVNKQHRFYRTLILPHRPNMSTIVVVLKMGVPVALALLCEVGLFCVTALMLAPLGTIQVGAHQVAINISSLLFIIPMSLGTGVSIRVAYNLGERNMKGVLAVTRTGYTLALVFAAITSVFVFTCRYLIIGIYTDDAAIVTLAASLLVYCALYQFSDSCNMIGTSVLRGYKDTFSLMLITFFSFWIIAVPIGYILGRTDLIVPRMGAEGFWIGFIVALTISSTLMAFRVIKVRNRFLMEMP